MGSQKFPKIDPGLIFKGLGGGPKNGPPSRGPKSEILQLFTTLELGPASQRGTPFWSHFGDLLCQKNEKRGFQKSLKNKFQKTLEMGPKPGGGDNFRSFLPLNPPRISLERSWTSIFDHFGSVLKAKNMVWGLWKRAFNTTCRPQTTSEPIPG